MSYKEDVISKLREINSKNARKLEEVISEVLLSPLTEEDISKIYMRIFQSTPTLSGNLERTIATTLEGSNIDFSVIGEGFQGAYRGFLRSLPKGSLVVPFKCTNSHDYDIWYPVMLYSSGDCLHGFGKAGYRGNMLSLSDAILLPERIFEKIASEFVDKLTDECIETCLGIKDTRSLNELF